MKMGKQKESSGASSSIGGKRLSGSNLKQNTLIPDTGGRNRVNRLRDKLYCRGNQPASTSPYTQVINIKKIRTWERNYSAGGDHPLKYTGVNIWQRWESTLGTEDHRVRGGLVGVREERQTKPRGKSNPDVGLS